MVEESFLQEHQNWPFDLLQDDGLASIQMPFGEISRLESMTSDAPQPVPIPEDFGLFPSLAQTGSPPPSISVSGPFSSDHVADPPSQPTPRPVALPSTSVVSDLIELFLSRFNDLIPCFHKVTLKTEIENQ